MSSFEFMNVSWRSERATYFVAASIEAFRESGEKFPK
jgi:hypothetical protein